MSNNVTRELIIGTRTAVDLVQEHGTPLYVYDASLIKKRYLEIREALTYPSSHIHYALKANAHPEILSLLASVGCGAETVSIGEIRKAKEAGFPNEKIVFTSSSLSREEFKKVTEEDVFINIDSLNQLRWHGELYPGTRVSIRINTDVGDGHHAHVVTGGALSKFGIHHTELDKVREIIKKYDLTIAGLHQHIGSFILDENMFIGGMNALLDIAREFESVDTLDFGGGWGVPYEPHEEALDIPLLGQKISDLLREFSEEREGEITARFEPGRFFVAEAGYLLTEVTDIKHHSNTTYVGVNTGFNHLIRPMMYGSYHEIRPIEDISGRQRGHFTIVGNICESGDVFARDRYLPEPYIGDVVAICDTGAYGASMASTYNARPLPQEIVV